MNTQAKHLLTTLLGITVLLALLAGPATAGNVIIGVPDWHQPCLIGGLNGPDNGGNPAVGAACYKAWCVPTSAADVMGYWRDQQGYGGIADAAAYVNQGTILWTPPTPTDWQDDSADASSIPIVGGGPRAAGADLGWYLNTNDQGDQTLPNAGGGEAFGGTKIADIQQGLTNYLTAGGYPTASVVHQAFPAAPVPANWITDFLTIKGEIDAGRPVLGIFTHGSFSETPPGSDEWEWDYPPYEDDQTGEDWGPNGSGHVMTIVGYQNPGDVSANMMIVVQDNRRHNVGLGGMPEADNNLYQHNLPFCTPAGGGLAPWSGYVTVNVPEPGTWALLLAAAIAGCFIARRRKHT